MKVVNLSVHKNNKKQREAKEFRKDAVNDFKIGISAKGIVGYAYLTWDKEGTVSTGYSISDSPPFPPHCLPEVAKVSLTARILEL